MALTVELVATPEATGPDALSCRESRVLGQGPSGQVLAHFMVDGYPGLGGVECPPV